MKKILLMNLMGFAATAALCASSGAMFMGCGTATNNGVKPAPIGSVPGATTQPPVNPATVVQDQSGLTDVNILNQTHVSAMLGQYSGSFAALKDEGNLVEQRYTLTISKVASSGGKQYFQMAFASEGMTFQALAQPYPFYNYGQTGYVLSTIPQNVPSMYTGGKIVLQLALSFNYSNQLELASFPIRIVNGVFYQDVVDFYNDFVKH